MKNIFCLLFFVLSLIVSGQTNDLDTLRISDTDKEQALLNRMTENLGLSTIQQQQVSKLLSIRSEQLESIRLMDISIDQRRDRTKEMNAIMRKSLQNILSDEQMDLYLSLRIELKEQRRKRGVDVNELKNLTEEF